MGEYFWQSEIAYEVDKRSDGSFIRRKALIDGRVVCYDLMDSNFERGTDYYARSFPDLKFLGEGEIYEINGIKQGRFRNMSDSERYCVTVEDVYGVPLAALSAPQGYEFTGEFRPPLLGDTILSGGRQLAAKVSPCYVIKYPRLILRALPTVESVYGGQTLEQLKENAKTATWDGDRSLKFEWTGEFRKVQPDEYFLGAPGGLGVNRNVHGIFTGAYRLIMRKCPTIKEVYGKELSELTPPIGYRFTGEFRRAKAGETALLIQGLGLFMYTSDECGNHPRLILEKLPPTPTIKDVYGTDTPIIPKGWVMKEFRQIKAGEDIHYLGFCGFGPVTDRPLHAREEVFVADSWKDGWRIVLEKELDLSTLTCTKTYTVEDAYGCIPTIPSGYKVIDFRIPRANDILLSGRGWVDTAERDWDNYPHPRLILSPLGPR